MKKSRFSGARIMGVLVPAENGVPVSEFYREHDMKAPGFKKWRVKFGDMDASVVSQMRSIDEEAVVHGNWARAFCRWYGP